MEERVVIKGTMKKTNIISIVIFIMGARMVIGCIFELFKGGYSFAPFVLGAVLMASSAYHHFRVNRCEITVTNKRVYGKATFGKRVDLPIDMISTVAVKAFKGISVATASGRVTFHHCQNRDEVFDAISRLLIERQEGKFTMHEPAVGIAPESNADELKKFKNLLDDGVITQEEFDAKKKQLLGL